jgi:hypothetical protein
MDFNEIFDTYGINKINTESRDKYLSRVFGIFNEEIIRVWCKSSNSQYIDIGRPTIKLIGESSFGSTLDFTLQDKHTKQNYISELKCEIQFENFKYLELTSVSQFKHHNKTAFQRFLGAATQPSKYEVKVKGKEISVEGAILIWGKTNPISVKSIYETTGLKEILSLENIINDLIQSKNEEYFKLLNQKQEWINHLINGLSK